MTKDRQFHKFTIITIIVPSAHDHLHVLNGVVAVRPSCLTPNSSQPWTSASKSDRWLRWFRFQTLRRISRQNALIRRPTFPPTFSAAALAVSAAIDLSTLMPAGRELRNASSPEEKKTLERQIKDQDDLIDRYQDDLTNAAGSSSSVSLEDSSSYLAAERPLRIILVGFSANPCFCLTNQCDPSELM